MWFYMILNLGKFQYLVINKDIPNESIELGKKTLHAQAKQKLLGIIIDNNFKLSKSYKVDYKNT